MLILTEKKLFDENYYSIFSLILREFDDLILKGNKK